MKTKKLFISVVALMIVAAVYADPIEEGKLIFSSRCAACHNVNRILTGPALAGVDKRHSIDWIVRFVQSSQSLIKSGDKDAVDLFNKFNKVPMPDHPDLSAENIKSVIEYINAETVATDSKAPFVRPTKLMTTYRPLSLSRDYLLISGYLFAVLLMIGVLLMAVHLRSLQNKQEKNLL